VDVVFVGLLGIVLSLGLALAGAFLYSLPVMLLWNAVIPAVFGLKPLTWLEALWLSLLCALLLKPTASSGTSEH